MKVSSNINVTTIYQNQLKKLQEAKSGDFDKMLHGASSDESLAGADSKGLSGLKSNKTDKVDLVSLERIEIPEKTQEEKLVFAAKAVAMEAEIRYEKVNHIKALVDAGQYNVSPEAVAEKLWSSGVVRHVW